jgi:hypothetical protein
MNVTQTTVDRFTTGSGTATGTAQAIAPGYSKKLFKGATIRCTSGAIYVGPSTVTTLNGFELPSGKELLIPIEDPSKVFVIGSGNYSFICV